MGSTRITMSLSGNDVSAAIKAVKQYKRDILAKCELLRKRIAERIAEDADAGFSGAIADDIIGGAKQADVSVTVSERGALTVVIATGNDAVFVEFGAGVYHNGKPGSSPNPYGAGLGFTIGTYGKGMGRRNVWGFYDGTKLQLTHGTKAVMPMSNAVNWVVNNIAAIVAEVFK